MNIANINDLKVNTSARLNNETKRNLVEIIENEFDNQCTVYSQRNNAQKEKILDDFRKKCNFKKLQRNVQKKEEEYERAKRELQATGFGTDGDLISSYGSPKEIKAKVKEIEDTIAKLEIQTPTTIKNKIISRLWLANSLGEAMVILREVLGNGIIPTVTKEQLALSYKEPINE